MFDYIVDAQYDGKTIIEYKAHIYPTPTYWKKAKGQRFIYWLPDLFATVKNPHKRWCIEILREEEGESIPTLMEHIHSTRLRGAYGKAYDAVEKFMYGGKDD